MNASPIESRFPELEGGLVWMARVDLEMEQFFVFASYAIRRLSSARPACAS